MVYEAMCNPTALRTVVQILTRQIFFIIVLFFSFSLSFSPPISEMYKYAKFDQNIRSKYGEVQELRAYSLKRPQPAKMMLGKALSPFCIPVAG